jgi:polysaccharide pyruvyl transferase WcaK-like protein
MKVLFINDSTSNPNWGDRAAAISLRAMISGVGGDIIASVSEHDLRSSTFFGDSFLPEDNPESRTRSIPRLLLPPLLLRLRRTLISNPDLTAANRLIPQKWHQFEKCAEAVLKNKGSWRALVRAASDSDVMVIHGDGAMVDHGVVPRTDLFITYLVKRYVGTPTIIVNHTADFNHPDLLEMAENIYPLFDDIVFRDPVSVERCRHFCKGRFVPDSAFWFEPVGKQDWVRVARRATYFDVWPDTARFDPSEPYICIGGSSKYSFEKKQSSIREGYTSLIRHIGQVYKGQIVLTASDITDEAMFRPIARGLSLPLVGVAIPVQQAVDIVGNADAYIGGRWHPAIFALQGGAPIVPVLSKTFKMQALAQMVGLPDKMFNVFDLDHEKEEIRQQLVSLLDTRADLRRTIAARARDLSNSSWDNVGFLNGQMAQPVGQQMLP